MNAPEQSLQRLATLQRLAAQQEDQAARQLAEALSRHGNAADRHTELVQYEIEYAARTPNASGVLALSRHAGFLSKLRDALKFQHDRVQQLGLEVDRARARWVGLHREVEKLEQLGEVARREMLAADSRRQSRELDELAQRGWVRQQQVAG